MEWGVACRLRRTAPRRPASLGHDLLDVTATQDVSQLSNRLPSRAAASPPLHATSVSQDIACKGESVWATASSTSRRNHRLEDGRDGATPDPKVLGQTACSSRIPDKVNPYTPPDKGRVWSIAEVVEHPQLAHRELLQRVQTRYGVQIFVGSGFKLAHGGGIERAPASTPRRRATAKATSPRCGPMG
jgi:hypothetical protein